MRNPSTALRLLTVLPLGSGEGERPAPYFTWVGLLFGALGLALLRGIALLEPLSGARSLVAGAAVVSAWAAFSGLLHWDGLADCADAMGVRGDAERRLAVMRESGIGAFGAAAIVLVAILQASSLGAIAQTQGWGVVVAAPVVGRLGAALALWTRRPARTGGLGSRYAVSPRVADVLMALVPIAAVVAAHWSWRYAAGIAGGVVFAAVVPGVFSRRLGGMTGDVLGATVLLSETFVLVVGALAGGAL